MKALILAAGRGTRLLPLTADCPKSMLLIGGVPLLERIVALLKRHGITDIAINLHYKPWSIVHHLGYGQRWGVRIHYSFEHTLLGSAGAAKRLEWFFDESFIVFSGAVYTNTDLSHLMQAHRQSHALTTIALHSTDNIAKSWVVELDAQSQVRRIVQTPTRDQVSSCLASAGIHVMEPEVLSELPADQPLDLDHDVVPKMLAAGQPVIGYPIPDLLIDIDTPASYQKTQQLVKATATPQAQDDRLPRFVAPTAQNLFYYLTTLHRD